MIYQLTQIYRTSTDRYDWRATRSHRLTRVIAWMVLHFRAIDLSPQRHLQEARLIAANARRNNRIADMLMRGTTAAAFHAIITRVRRGMSVLAEIFFIMTLTMKRDKRITPLIAMITRKIITDPVEVEVTNKPSLIIRISGELSRLTSLGTKIMLTTSEIIVRQMFTRDRATVHRIKTTLMMTDTTDLRGGVMTIDVLTMTTISQILTIVMAVYRIKIHLN